jgi:putative copper resistance protein D
MKVDCILHIVRRWVLTSGFILALLAPAAAQQSSSLAVDLPHAGHHGQHGRPTPEAWEGSAKGIAYSERNHHIAGLLVILMGVAELTHAMRLAALGWVRLLLPSALLCAGTFLLIWSDHEAWPIGPLTFGQSFFGDDHEIIQHKFYGILALVVGSVELFRRLGRAGHRVWASPLPLMAIVGGLMLFGHSHGFHPSAQKIATHHAIMGTMALTAGSSKLFSTWLNPTPAGAAVRWDWIWASFILLIGTQLLIYSE